MPAPVNAAIRRYFLRFTPAMTAYVVVLFVVVLVLKRHAPVLGGWLYALAVLPALPILVVIWAMGRFLVEQTDEYLRARLIEVLLWASGLTMATTTVWGFLEAFAAVPHLPAYYDFVLFCAFMGAVQAGGWMVDRLPGRSR